jgi:predicted small integral membrane protein
LLNVFLLCAILIAFSAVAGLAFGGIRLLFNRILPESVLHREKEVDFISLNLSEGQAGAVDSKVSPSIKAG